MSTIPDVILKLDPLHDMDPIMIGNLNNIDHLGLHLRAERLPRAMLYGRIVEISHGQHRTIVKVRWNGQTDEIMTDPEHTVRIETTIGETHE